MQTPADRAPDLNIEDVSVLSPRAITNTPDAGTYLNAQTLEREQDRVEIAKLRAELESLKQDILQRRTFAPKLYVLTCVWLLVVIAILLLQGFSEGRYHIFRLNDGVLIALLGTTTINVVGLFYVVAKYLFPEKGRNTFRGPEEEKCD